MTPIVERTRAREAFNVLGGALELLESAHLLERVSGIYALESLAREDASARQSAVEILSALVRRRAGRATQSSEKVAGDVQAALAVLGRLKREEGEAPLDLHGISLRGAFLPGAKLAGAFLYDCDWEGALLQGADLRGAWLWRTNLRRVNLDQADLSGADLSGARGLKSEQIANAKWDEATRWPRLDD